MAKKSKKAAAARATGSAVKVKLNDRDQKTMKDLVGLADRIVDDAQRKRDPYLDIPTRSLSNVRYNKSKGFIEMGSNSNRRQLFNLSQAKSYMQTVLVASGCKSLVEQSKTTSIRGLYYLLKHSIEGTREETFDTQEDCDPVIEDVEVTLNTLREALHVYASNRGGMVGPITLIDSGDEIDCARMGSGGYSIPSIVEPEVIKFEKNEADFILHVEKDTVWRRFNEDKFWRTHNCILTHGGGQPPRGVRRLLNRMHNDLTPGGIRDKECKLPPLPIYCLLDNDPWGYYIYSVLKQGSINLAYESARMAIPNAKFLGLRSIDFERCGLSPSVRINLNEQDIKRAKQIAAYPWFSDKTAKCRAWQKEIATMISNGFKLEVEALISKDISYVTEVYAPARIAEKDWLE